MYTCNPSTEEGDHRCASNLGYTETISKLSIFASKWFTIILFTPIPPNLVHFQHTECDYRCIDDLISRHTCITQIGNKMVRSSRLKQLERKALWPSDSLVCTCKWGRHSNGRDRSQMSWIFHHLYKNTRKQSLGTYLLLEFPLKQCICLLSSTCICVRNCLDNTEKHLPSYHGARQHSPGRKSEPSPDWHRHKLKDVHSSYPPVSTENDTKSDLVFPE